MAKNKETKALSNSYLELLDNPEYYHHVKRGTDRKHLRLDNKDHLIIKAVSSNKSKPITTVLHCMIGQSFKCWEEKHEFAIQELLTEVVGLRHILRLYRDKYGKLPVVKKRSSL